MKLSDFDYNLPTELIADEPNEPRDHSRLLVLDKSSGGISHMKFYDIVRYLHKDDVLVVNNSKVFPARLLGQKEITHGKVEILLEHEIEPGLWQCLGRGLGVGKRIVFPNSSLAAVIKDKKDDIYEVLFNLSGKELFDVIDTIGHVPLPPYILKARKNAVISSISPPETGGARGGMNFSDKESYQTVYAKPRGSVAAPTAGLHFTPELIDQIKTIGVKVLEITLHVGLGTFAPVKSDDIIKHKMHSEYFSVTAEVLSEIIEAKKTHRRVIAVGTTTTRVLEHLFSDPLILDTCHVIHDVSGQTNIFIYPGYEYKCVDALITNFHLPKSTLLMLISAFAGREKIMRAYEEAIKNKYRFYSYGDAMVIT